MAIDLTLSPYTVENGWLPAGSADLALTIGITVTDENQTSLPTLYPLTASGGTIDLGRTLAVTLGNGTALKVSGTYAAGPQYADDTGSVEPDRTYNFRSTSPSRIRPDPAIDEKKIRTGSDTVPVRTRRTTHNGLFLAAALVIVMLTAACGGPRYPPDSTPPSVVPDFMTVLPDGFSVDQMTGMTPLVGDTGKLVGPNSSIEVDAVGRFSTLSQDDITEMGLDTTGMSAPAGHQLLFAHISDIDLVQGLVISPTDRTTPSIAIKIGDQVRPIAETVQDNDMVIVSVPTGGDADLQLTDTGRTQSLSLSTGRRGSDAIALYYSVFPKHITAHLKTNFAWKSVLSVPTTVYVTVDASLSPYTDKDGWLPTGTADLTLSIGTSVFDSNTMSLPTSQFLTATGASVDLGRTLAVTLANGTAVKLSGSDDAGPQYLNEAGEPAPDQTFHFRVPATTTHLTLTFRATGTIKYQDDKTVRRSPMTGSTRTTVPVDFTAPDPPQ